MSETLARSLIRLIVTVGILAAVFFFIVKPILDTTNNAFDSVNSSLDNAFDDVGIDSPNLDGVGKSDAQKVLDCVERVQPNTTKMQQCTDRFLN